MSNSDYHTTLEPSQIEQNFSEINPLMSRAEALTEASRCLYCSDAPCMHACPTHIDVPGFIKKIASGNLTGSARVIFDANPIGATCARVCPVEVLCEGACVEKTLLQKPIEIGRLQRYATDHVLTNGTQIFEKGESNGKSVGVIGSGPAGLSCAAYLTRLGYDVTIYDQKEKPGGLDTYGMAEYKMQQAVSLAETERIAAMGVKFMLNTRIVAVAAPDEPEVLGEVNRVNFDLLNEWHDAIFLGVGLGTTNKLGIPGEDLEGVYDALHFIYRIKTRVWWGVPLGRPVAVIGAGNTAIVAFTQAKRLGAEKVVMVYRRTERDASAYHYEMELARKDGVEFVWQAAPVGILAGENGNRLSLRCEKTDGTLRLFEIPCDMVIKAVGQQKMLSFFSDVAGVATDDRGRVIVNEHMQTSNPKVFAGGDCANGGAEAVDAAQMGKLAAMGIHETMTGEKITFAGSNVT